MKHPPDPTPVLVVLAVATLVISGYIRRLRRRRASRTIPWPLTVRPTVLTAVEQVLYRRLIEALPEYVILGQVSLRQVVDVRGNPRDWSLINRFDRLTLDFLVTSREFAPVVAIELDDSTHLLPDRRDADARKNHALQSAGLPLIRWSVRSMPDAEAIRQAVAEAARR